MNEESSTHTDRKSLKEAGGLTASLLPSPFEMSKRLAAASFFAYDDKRMAARVLHHGAFIIYAKAEVTSATHRLSLIHI